MTRDDVPVCRMLTQAEIERMATEHINCEIRAWDEEIQRRFAAINGLTIAAPTPKEMI